MNKLIYFVMPLVSASLGWIGMEIVVRGHTDIREMRLGTLAGFLLVLLFMSTAAFIATRRRR